MKFDDILKDAWQGETRQVMCVDFTRRVRRQRQLLRLQRALEVTLTLVACWFSGSALASGRAGPSHWLLLPFFVCFLPVAWAVTLRTPRQSRAYIAETTQVYAQLRVAQLRTRLRDLWLARAAAWWLLGYAMAANVGVWVLGEPRWRTAGMTLLGVALIWIAGTFLLSQGRRQVLLREYRAMLRLLGLRAQEPKVPGRER